MKTKIYKLIIIISSLLLIATIGFSFVVSQNTHHIDTCCEEDCALCEIIHIARDFIYKTIIPITNVFIILLLFKIFNKACNHYYFTKTKSLVYQNVQLNE